MEATITQIEWKEHRELCDIRHDRVREMAMVLMGNKEAGVPGVMHRLEDIFDKLGDMNDSTSEKIKDLDDRLTVIEKQRLKDQAIVKGIGIGIGLNVLTGGATLVTLINLLAGQ